jgi:hypothetical protein
MIMNAIKEVVLVFFVVMVVLLLVIISPLFSVITTQAQKQEQRDKPPLSMTLKFKKSSSPNLFGPKGSTTYDVYNITSNLQESVLKNETVQFNLNNTNVHTYLDQPVYFFIQGNVTGREVNNTGDIQTETRTQKNLLFVSFANQFTKQTNKRTNITTYTEQVDLRPCLLFCGSAYSNVDAKVTIYPNNTGIAELKQNQIKQELIH